MYGLLHVLTREHLEYQVNFGDLNLNTSFIEMKPEFKDLKRKKM